MSDRKAGLPRAVCTYRGHRMEPHSKRRGRLYHRDAPGSHLLLGASPFLCLREVCIFPFPPTFPFPHDDPSTRLFMNSSNDYIKSPTLFYF
jgi:hypothetical protein